MKPKLGLLIILIAIVLMTLFLSSVPKCNAQQTGLTITFDEYNWNSDMKQVSMTTPDRGLILAITIYNNNTQPFDSIQGFYGSSLYIFITINNDDNPQLTVFSKTLTFDSNNGGLYLPPYESEVRYVKVTAYSVGSNLPIGSYNAKLSYSNYQFPSEVSTTPIGSYPFNFKVQTESILQQTIQANKNSGTIINIGPFNFTLLEVSISSGISITIISFAVVAYLLRKKKRK
jgi:hypothetical protein